MNGLKQFVFAFLFLAANLFSSPAGWPPKWLDLPQDNYSHLLQVEQTPEFDALHSLLAKYHALPKTEIGALSMRIALLNQIAECMEELKNTAEDPLLKRNMGALLLVCQNKAWYLTKLQEGYASGFLDLDYPDTLLEELTSIPQKNAEDCVLFLSQTELFNPFVVEYWGDYRLEYVDPCHRKLWSYHQLWKSKGEKTPFFLWLEEQNLSIDVPFVHYCTAEELSLCACRVVDGSIIYRSSGKLVGEGEAADLLFCVNLDRELLVIKEQRTIHHTSITYGKPVLAIGRMIIKEGRIIYFSFDSGHYLPSIEEGKAMVSLFKEMGIVLSNTLTIGFFNSFGMQTTDLKTFMDTELHVLEALQQ